MIKYKLEDKERIKIEIEKLKDEKENLMFDYQIIYSSLIPSLIALFVGGTAIMISLNRIRIFTSLIFIGIFIVLFFIVLFFSDKIVSFFKKIKEKRQNYFTNLQQKIQQKYGELLK
ncbi:MAG: hypothetical protein QXX68_00645 [Candidatus Pacearchaeota archaeon]